MRCLNSYRRIVLRGMVIPALLAAVLFVAPDSWGGDPFSFSANGNYRESGGDEIDTNDSFNHSYNLTFDKELSSMMDMSTSARYNETLFSEGNDSSSFNPSAFLDLRNDLFTFNLSGSHSHIDVEEAVPYDNKTWGANIYSHLDKWPSVRLSYNQSSTQDDEDIHLQDDESSTFGASIDYAVAGVSFLYDLRYGTADDYVDDSSTDTTNHYAQVKYNNSFFRNRLSVSASRQYSYNKTTTNGPLRLVTVLTGLFSIDDTPATGVLTENRQLVDGDVETRIISAELTRNDDVPNVGIQVDFQNVNQLRIYFNRQISLTEEAVLQWEVYQSDNNSVWRIVTQTSSPAFELQPSGNTMVTLGISSTTARYLKVVISKSSPWPSATSAYVTEIEAGELQNTGADRDTTVSKFTSHQTQFSVSYRPTTNWVAGYSFRQVLNLPDSGLDNTQVTHSANASYSPSVYFSLALGATEYRDDIDGAEDSLSRSYSVAVNSSPLATLDTSLSYTRTHNYEDGEEISLNDLVNANLAAEIFPDLTANLSPFWSRSQDLDTENKTTTYGFTLNNNVRLTPRLDLTGYWNYARSDAETEEEEEEEEAYVTMTRQYGATLSYRPSDILLVSSSVRRDQDEDTTTLSGNMTWLVTRNIQTNGGVSWGLGEDDPDEFTGTVNWMVTRNLSLQGGGNYQLAEAGDTWSVATSLNINY